MFASLVATVVLTGSLAMPIAGNGNDYLGPNNDWAPLMQAYERCGVESNTLIRYICAEKHYVAATTNLKKA